MQIYLVVGVTGEYEDRSEWNAVAFIHENDANKLCDQLNYIAKQYDQSCGYGNRELMKRVLEELRALDPSASMDYNGTTYHVQFVELRE